MSELAVRDEVFREDVCILPRELSMIVLVRFRVLTAGEQTILRKTWRVLT